MLLSVLALMMVKMACANAIVGCEPDVACVHAVSDRIGDARSELRQDPLRLDRSERERKLDAARRPKRVGLTL